MKKLVLFPFTIMLVNTLVLGYKQEDLDKLRATNKCAPFDLRGADLSGAKLPKAKLRDSNPVSYTHLTLPTIYPV